MTATADAKIADMIRSRGLDFGPTNIREANRTDFPIGLAFALIDQESEFQKHLRGGHRCAVRPANPSWFHLHITDDAPTASTVSSVTSTP